MRKILFFILFTLFFCTIYCINSIALADINFGPNVRVDDTASSDTPQGSPSIALDTLGNIYLAWMDSRNGNPDIYFTKSTNGGATFESNVCVTGLTNWELSPSLIVDTFGNIYIAWENWGSDNSNTNRTDIYLAKSTDGGISFGSSVRVDDTGIAVSEQRHVSLGVDLNKNIYAAWMDRRNGTLDIYLSKSTDEGITFGPNIRVDDTGSSNSTQSGPSISVGETGNIYAIWSDDRNGDYDIYFAKSTDGATSFGSSIRVDDAGSTFSHVQDATMTVDKNENIYAAWRDRRNSPGTDIYFTRSINQGVTFDANFQVDPLGASLPSDQNHPSVAVDEGGNIYLAWDQNDIYFAESTDGGLSFTPRVRVDDTGDSWSSSQDFPSLAVDKNSNVYIAWRDNRNGNYDIYFAKGVHTDVIPEPSSLLLLSFGLLGAGVLKRKKLRR